jgi:hypothetical protein
MAPSTGVEPVIAGLEVPPPFSVGEGVGAGEGTRTPAIFVGNEAPRLTTPACLVPRDGFAPPTFR